MVQRTSFHAVVHYSSVSQVYLLLNDLYSFPDNFEKEHTSSSKLENITFTNALEPISQDRVVFCRSLFHNTATDQYVYSMSSAVLLHKLIEKTNEKTENATGLVTVTTNNSNTFFNVGDTVHYTCESNIFTVATKLSAMQRFSKGKWVFLQT